MRSNADDRGMTDSVGRSDVTQGRIGMERGGWEEEGSNGKGIEGWKGGRRVRGRDRAEGTETVDKGKRGLDLDICPGIPELL